MTRADISITALPGPPKALYGQHVRSDEAGVRSREAVRIRFQRHRARGLALGVRVSGCLGRHAHIQKIDLASRDGQQAGPSVARLSHEMSVLPDAGVVDISDSIWPYPPVVKTGAADCFHLFMPVRNMQSKRLVNGLTIRVVVRIHEGFGSSTQPDPARNFEVLPTVSHSRSAAVPDHELVVQQSGIGSLLCPSNMEGSNRWITTLQIRSLPLRARSVVSSAQARCSR